jgi:hypothetical protein
VSLREGEIGRRTHPDGLFSGAHAYGGGEIRVQVPKSFSGYRRF